MFSQYFGHYLLNKNLVTPEELSKALDFQDSAHVKLGVLALNAGYLTVDQIDEIYKAQTKKDKRFGELAIEMGYLTTPQVEELLAAQKQGHLLLGQALIDKGYLSLEQLEFALDEYKEEYRLSDLQFFSLKEGSTNEIVKTFVDWGDSPLKESFSDYLSLLLRNLIRFAHETPRVENTLPTPDFSAPWLVYQEISGPINLFTGIAADEKVLLDIAGKSAGERFSEPNELATASAAEFLNLHNGIFLVNMSNNGVELEMKPQLVSRDQKLTGLDKGYVIPVNVSSGKLYLIISEINPFEFTVQN